MIDTGGLRKGLIIDHENELLKIIDFQHVKQGRGSAFVRVTLRNIRSGSTVQQTFQAGARFQRVRLERQRAQYLYAEGNEYHFMDLDSFEQFVLDSATLGDALNYLKVEDSIDLLTHKGQPIDIEIPITVNLVVTQTDPGFKGDTATGGTKPATVETGLTISVPLFVTEGETIKVDTRNGTYLERVS